MNFPEFPSIGLLLGSSISFIGNPEFAGIFPHFPGEGFWSFQIAFSGEDEVDVLGRSWLLAKALRHTESHLGFGRRPAIVSQYQFHVLCFVAFESAICHT